MTTPIPLTSVLRDRNLTVVRPLQLDTVKTLTQTDNWIDDTGAQMVTDTGDELVFYRVYDAYPFALTATLRDRQLTVERP